jgi:DNA-binding CsgD family transcriptional regulator
MSESCPLERLTQPQLDVVRLVAEFKSSKQIARELGISSNTVDQRLKRVQALLGVESRFAAARLYLLSCGPLAGGSASGGQGPLWGDLVYQTSGLPDDAPDGDAGTSPDTLNRSGDGQSEMHQSQAGYVADLGWTAHRRSITTVLLEAGRQNDLTPLARTLCIGAITLGALLSLAAAVALAEGMSRLL